MRTQNLIRSPAKRLAIVGLAIVGLVVAGSGILPRDVLAPDAEVVPGTAARAQVARQVAAELGPHLPPVPVAILPPEIAVPGPAGEVFASSWESALAAALQAAAEVELTERGALEAILREQKFADSAYADPDTAVEVGKIVAARALVSTRLNEWTVLRFGVLVDLEVRLLDVQTGQVLWVFASRRRVWPPGLLLAATLLALVLLASALGWMSTVWGRRRRQELCQTVLPVARRRLRIDLDGLVRALALARDRIHQQRGVDGSATVQQAMVELEVVLDRVRHALPGVEVLSGEMSPGEMSSGGAGLDAAARQMQHIERLVEELRRATETADDAKFLARRLLRARGDLTTALDAFRSAAA